MSNSQRAIQELHKAFNLLNQAYYEGKLPEPYIVIHSTVKQKAYGWFTPDKSWTDKDGQEAKHEIAMSAEYMNRDYIEVIGTLHHEMIHLYCETNNIKDTTRQNRYHNNKFKEEAEKRGFKFDEQPHKTYGWGITYLTDELKEVIKSFNLEESAFSLARKIYSKKPAKPSNQVKYVCISCDNKLRGKSGMNIVCGDCEETMMEEE